MVDGINRFALRALGRIAEQPGKYWHRDFFCSVVRVERRTESPASTNDPGGCGSAVRLVPASSYRDHGYRVGTRADRELHRPRRSMAGPSGRHGRRSFARSGQPPRARAIVLPDADWTPEAFAGLTTGVDSHSQLPRRLAENGVQVVVPTLISRDDALSGNPDIRFTNQPHREFIYRMAFELGRHVIGYEIEKTLAAVDIFSQMNANEGHNVPIGVAGVGEGGLVAFYAAAVDRRFRRRWSADTSSLAKICGRNRSIETSGHFYANSATRRSPRSLRRGAGDRGGFRSERERPPRAARWPYGCGPRTD